MCIRVEIYASLAELQRDPSSGTWAVESARVFQKAVRASHTRGGSAATAIGYVGDASKAIVERVEVTKVSNDLPANIGFVANEVPGELTLSDGTKLLCAANSNERSNVHTVVYTAPCESYGAWTDVLATLTPEQLRSEFPPYLDDVQYSVLAKSSHMAYLFELNKNHPLVADAYANKVDLGARGIRVKTAALEMLHSEMCELIEGDLRVKRPCANLCNFAVRIVRTDGRAWTDTTGIKADPFASRRDIVRMLTQQHTVSLHLTVTYVLPTMAATADAKT